MIRMLVAMERPLEVVANTNPAVAPKGESPLARLNKYIELSPSGKATDFDSVIRGFKSRQLSQKVKPPLATRVAR